MTELHSAMLRLPNGRSFGTLHISLDGLPSNWVDPASGRPVRLESLVDIGVQSSGLQRAHFLQFLWKELIITTPRGTLRSDGPSTARGGDYNRNDIFFTPNPASNDTRRWFVDWLADPRHPDAPPVPFYDANGWTMTDARVSYLTMRDAPMGGNAREMLADAETDLGCLNRTRAPGVPTISRDDRILYMDYHTHFDTYLLAAPRGRIQFLGHVEWMVDRRGTNPRQDTNLPAQNPGIVHYSFVRSGRARHLPEHLGAVIRRDFPAYSWLARI